MPGLQQNDNRKPNLSFGGTQAIRQLMLAKNLPNPMTSPYFDKQNTGPDEFSDAAYRVEMLRDMAVPNGGTVDELGEYYLDKSYLANAYGPPGGFGDWVQIYDIRTGRAARVNEGFYPNFTAPETGTGLFGENPFRQIAQYYSPIDILLGVTTQGLLSTALLEDSELQQQGAIQLRYEFQERIAQEIYQETIGRLNFLEALKDPFKALDIVTGRESLIERDNNITVPKSLVGQGLDFIGRISGVYVPRSYIPGDYFDLEPPRGLGLAGKIVSDITGIMGSLLGIPRRRQSPSQRFLEYTGGGTKSQLFKHIRYNVYGPQYGEGAQAQTAIGAGFGEAIDFIAGGILGAGNMPPNPPQYVGGPRNRVADMTSPPTNTYAGENYVPQFGPDAVAKEFDENIYNFGLNGLAYANQGSVPGGFTWYTDKTPGSGFLNSIASLFNSNVSRVGPQVPGTSQGQEGSTDDTKKYEIPPDYDKTKSTNYDFRDDSLMGVTQQIIDSVPKGGAALKSVSHSINQVSKVFNDGYKELTKGSRVKRFINTDPFNEKNPSGVGRGAEVPTEYCRVWTKDIPYYTYGRLIKTQMNHRKETYSVLDSPFNLNIAPWRTDESGKGSTNIKDGKVKKYMFSLENLAWRSSAEKGFTYDDLPSCEKGPNGGRIMWFPPYDLKVDESSNANWTENNFVGRPEPIYTYNNTNRTGTLNFKIVVDHPSVLNMVVRKQLANLGPKETDALVDSFFAGCKNYDIYDLARKWKQFSVNELEATQLVLNSRNISQNSEGEAVQQTTTETPELHQTSTEIPDLSIYNGLSFYFDNDVPGPADEETSTSPFNVLADTYLNPEGPTLNDYLAQITDENQKIGFTTWYKETALKSYHETWKEFAKALNTALSNNLTVKLSFEGSSSTLASNAYNLKLSHRRLNAVRQMFENYVLAGQNVFKIYLDKNILQFPSAQALGEDVCSGVPDSGPAAIYSEAASKCRRVYISGIEVEELPTESIPPAKKAALNQRVRPLVKKEEVNQLKNKNTRREIANKILQKMVTECDYFDLIKEENEFIYDTLKDKFKFFQPAFHAITPEGLNSRLTFLNQCVRPGSTIPTRQEGGNVSTDVDAKNTAFGAPPICILRVGDFYHTKIAIDNISFTYDDNLLDLNPEGIGVQPMIASVTVTFKYLGGQGLKEPVNRLQNALSFNYYGNTEMYDDRSILTVTDDDPDEAKWISQNQDLIGTTQGTGAPQPDEDAENTADEDTSPNDGITIGNRENPKLTTTGETGTIKYEKTFTDINEDAYTYLKEVNGEVFKFLTNYNYALIELLFAEKEWNTGKYYRATSATLPATEITGELVGIPLNYQSRFNSLVANYKTRIENETTEIQKEFIAKGNPTQSQRRKLKDFLEERTDDAAAGGADVAGYLSDLNTALRSAHIEYLKNVTPLNVINRGGDGFIEEGKCTTFQLSGQTPVDTTSDAATQGVAATDTLVELGSDYFYLTNMLTYYSKLMNGSDPKVFFDGTSDVSTYELLAPGKYSLVGGVVTLVTKEENKLKDFKEEYLLFSNEMLSKEIIDNNIPLNNIKYFKEYSSGYNGDGEFFTSLKEELGITTTLNTQPTWLYDIQVQINRGIALNENKYIEQFVAVNNNFIDKVVGSEGPSYLTQGLSSDNTFNAVGNNIPIKNEKTRKLGYTKVTTSTTIPTIEQNLRDYNSKKNSEDDTFNLKFN